MQEYAVTLTQAGIRQLFRSLRAETPHTQYSLAEVSGVHRNTLHNLECGSVLPNLRVLVAVAEATGYEVVVKLKESAHV